MDSESRAARRLAAILAADVAGYSRLMEIDEEGTLAALKAHRKELIDPLITQHQGRIVKTMGDGLLLEFASIVDAVRCAVVMQQGMESRNANIDEDRRIRFRVGINVGDVIVEGEDIFGDGVNVAARLEALAEPGQTCVSATVREHVAEKLPVGFADMGEHTVKNIARPVHVYRIKTPIGSEKPNSAIPAQGMLTLPERPSIAVLPFTNLSGDPEQDYLADGIVEDVITGLSRIKWLFVIARNSSFTYKGKAVNVRQVGRELGVRYVLEGSIRKAANRVRITGQLIEADTDRHIWADRYDRTLDDVFAIQDELTMSVVAAMEPSLRQAEIERVKRMRPDSLDAYDLVLRAMPLVYTAMPDGAAKALPFLESALKIESDYALAHAYTAFAHEIIFARGGMREENRTSATRHAYEAINYGRDDAIALTIGGFVLALVAHDRATARQALEAALTLSPSCALTYVLGSVVLVYDGQADKGIEWGELALRLSPFDPMSQGPFLAIALGRFQRANMKQQQKQHKKAFRQGPIGVSYMLRSPRHRPSLVSWIRLGRPLDAFLNCSPSLRLAGYAPVLNSIVRLPSRSPRRLKQLGCRVNAKGSLELEASAKREEPMIWTTTLLNCTAVAASAIALICSGPATALPEEVVLRMIVPDWPPTHIMKDMFDKSYKAPSGNEVKLDVDFIPWPDYYTRLNTSLVSDEKKYNMAVSDSQWLGTFVEAGYYRKINDLIDADPGLKATLVGMHPNALQAYATYPYKSENYYGFPQMPDILINYYRTDIVCNEAEQRNFQAKYLQKLPCTPEEMDDVDWDTFERMGEFFMRKKGDMLAGKRTDDYFYGFAYQAGRAYNNSTRQINGFIWQHGGNIWDETQAPIGHAEGVVNSPAAVKALEHYLRLTKYMPPIVKTGGMDALKTDELFREGKLAMNIEYIGLAENTINPKTSKVAGKVAFAQMPGLRGADGKLIRWSNIGGQPFVIMTWSNEKQIKEIVDFVKWWLSIDTQHAFAAAGGQSAIKSVYNDPKYLDYRPWNRAWAPGLEWQKDAWRIPEFFELLVQGQEQYDLAITGKQDARTTLNNIAAFQEKLLRDAGYIQ